MDVGGGVSVVYSNCDCFIREEQMMDVEVYRLLFDPPLTDEELRKQARAFLASLALEEYEQLKSEKLASSAELRLCKFQFLRRAGFTDLEARVFSNRPFEDSEVRMVIARRVLAVEMGGVGRGLTFFEACRLEAKVLRGLSDNEVIERLKVYGCAREG